MEELQPQDFVMCPSMLFAAVHVIRDNVIIGMLFNHFVLNINAQIDFWLEKEWIT